MTDLSTIARDNAISLEGKKDGLYQKKGADWVVRFTIQETDLDERLRKAPLGSRFILCLVEIDDNEQPGNAHREREAKSKAAVASVASRETADHHGRGSVVSRPQRKVSPDKRLAQQAGIACADPVFRRFLYEHDMCPGLLEDEAATAVRLICGVSSRKDIVIGTEYGKLWDKLFSEFTAWKLAPEVSTKLSLSISPRN